MTCRATRPASSSSGRSGSVTGLEPRGGSDPAAVKAATARYAAAIDQGTTGTRFMVFGRDGRPLCSAYREHRQIYPSPGWVEHDPMEIWQTTQEVIATALRRGGIGPYQPPAVGATNQRETTLACERPTGRP